MYLVLGVVLLVLFLVYDYRRVRANVLARQMRALTNPLFIQRNMSGVPGPYGLPLLGTVPKIIANMKDMISFHKRCINTVSNSNSVVTCA